MFKILGMTGMTDPDVLKLSCHESRSKTPLPVLDLNSLKRLVAVLWGLWILQNHEAWLDSVLAMIVHRYFKRTTKFHILYSQTVQFLGNRHMPPCLFLVSFGFNWNGLGFAKPKASAFSMVVFSFFTYEFPVPRISNPEHSKANLDTVLFS